MSITYGKVRTEIDLSALVHNWKLLNSVGGRAVPVIKSDAYGHGLERTAEALARAGADSFAVGTVEEGVQLRASGCAGRIIALLGPIEKWEYRACIEDSILPFAGNFEQLAGLAEAARGAAGPVEVVLKFDTGMSRLGFREPDLDRLAEFRAANPGVRPVMAASHLATADDPGQEEFTLRQHDVFSAIVAGLRARGMDVASCLANSAGILAHASCRFDMQRAGIALYGVNPFRGTAWEDRGGDLRPAMEVAAPVVTVRDLAPGDSVSYGRTFVADGPMRVAVVAVGYADAYSRGLSNTGSMLIHGKRARITGRVCMQMTEVDVTHIPEVRPGDRAVLLGGAGPERISADELAGWWKTITYEVFCLLGLNPRTYVNGL